MRLTTLVVVLVSLMVWLGAGSAAQAALIPDTAPPSPSAGSASPAFSWDDLVNGRLDWGQPPWLQDELNYNAQALPQAAGWLRYFGRGGDYTAPLAAGEGLVLVYEGRGLLALRVEDGSEAWRYPCDTRVQYVGLALHAEHVYFKAPQRDGADTLVALNAADGSEAWRQSGLVLLGLAPGGVWAALRYSAGRQVYSSLRLLDAATGALRHSFDLPPDYLPPYPLWRTETAFWPVPTPDSLSVAYSDGRIVELTRGRPGWDMQLGLAQDALLLFEWPPLEQRVEAELYAREHPQGPTPDLELSELRCFDLPGGSLRWRRDGLTRCWPANGKPFYPVVGNKLVLYERRELTTLSLDDGVTARQWVDTAPPDDTFGGGWIVPAPGEALYTDGLPGSPPGWYRLDLNSGADPVAVAALSEATALKFALDGWLICDAGLFAWGGGEHTSALLALRLGADGLPLTGALDLNPPQPDYSELGARFAACPEPLADPELLCEIGTQGINAVLALLPAVAPEDSAHLDTLLAEAIFLYNMDGLRRGSREQLRLFFNTLARRARLEYAPALLRWLNMPELGWLPREAQLALAYCGGPEARDYLCAQYAVREVQRLEPPAPPYALVQPELGKHDHTQRAELIDAGLWAQVELAGNRCYAVFPAPGLRNTRDLYAAYDADGDGRWEWVLPTGLQDVFFEYHRNLLLWELDYPRPAGQLALGIPADAALRISHNRPAPGQGNPPPKGEELRIEYTVDKLPLADILRDSDGDGLTDLTEAELLTDPAQADTDGDGTEDARDATPLADPARMGAIERGIARAMSYYFTESYAGGGWFERWERPGLYATGLPWSARYFTVSGCGPVAFSASPATYGICINTPEQYQAYMQGATGMDEDSLISVNWQVRAMTPQQRFAASNYGVRVSYEEYVKEYGEPRWLESVDFDDYPQADMVVGCSYAMHGSAVLLIDVAGEYIPVGEGSSWVAD